MKKGNSAALPSLIVAVVKSAVDLFPRRPYTNPADVHHARREWMAKVVRIRYGSPHLVAARAATLRALRVQVDPLAPLTAG
jgi:hypothetical protein